MTGGSYMATVKVGSPGQTQTLAIDTGSSDVWLLDVSADACTDPLIQEQYQDGCATTCKLSLCYNLISLLTLPR